MSSIEQGRVFDSVLPGIVCAAFVVMGPVEQDETAFSYNAVEANSSQQELKDWNTRNHSVQPAPQLKVRGGHK